VSLPNHDCSPHIISDPDGGRWCKRCGAIANKEMILQCHLLTAPRAAEANSEWHGGKVESIPEYFTKPRIVEDLAAAHPVLLVRQLANEILRLRALAPVGQNAALPSGEFTNRKPEAHGEGPAVAAPCGPAASPERKEGNMSNMKKDLDGLLNYKSAPRAAEAVEDDTYERIGVFQRTAELDKSIKDGDKFDGDAWTVWITHRGRARWLIREKHVRGFDAKPLARRKDMAVQDLWCRAGFLRPRYTR
jgi:hypothetical protein